MRRSGRALSSFFLVGTRGSHPPHVAPRKTLFFVNNSSLFIQFLDESYIY